METIKVNLAERSYQIWIDQQLLDRLPDLLAEKWNGKQVVVITQALLAEQYGQKLTGALSKSGFNTALLLLPAGEEAKALVQGENVYRQ